MSSAISHLQFPFSLKRDQLEAVDSWINNNFRGTVLYSSGTGKTEIAFECARRAALAASISLAARSNIISQRPNSRDSLTAFNILYLVPRIVLIEQNVRRLLAYDIPREKIGVYFGERKVVREITISTYQSALNNIDLIRKSSMVIFDEVHLISDTAKIFCRIFDIVIEDHDKAILGLTATIDEADIRYNTIMTIAPPVKKYPIMNAVSDQRLAAPIIIPLEVTFTEEERRLYDSCSTKIKNISRCLKTCDAPSISSLLKTGGFVSGMAKAWFKNVRKRKALLSSADNKLWATINIIKKHPYERIMVFSETLESITKLKNILAREGLMSEIIDHKVDSQARYKILSEWGNKFYPLLSVHTLEIGYDIPQARIEVILASTSNMNQAIQRIGRIVRKHKGKDLALIYVVYVSDTNDDTILDLIKNAIDPDAERGKKCKEKEPYGTECQGDKERNMDKVKVNFRRTEKAYNIIEASLYQPGVFEQMMPDKECFRIRSSTTEDTFYYIDTKNRTCTCPDFRFRSTKCKHILAIEFSSLSTISGSSIAAAQVHEHN